MPTLVVQGDRDPVVDPESTALLFNQIGAQQKKYAHFNFTRHGILAGEGSGLVHAEIGAFIEAL